MKGTGHHAGTATAMEHTTATEIDALEAEINALLEEDTAQTARINALLATGSAAVRLADCQVMAAQLERNRRVQARYQRRIARGIEAL
jgi:hypothetical protein